MGDPLGNETYLVEYSTIFSISSRSMASVNAKKPGNVLMILFCVASSHVL